MMIGLPGDTFEKSLFTAQQIIQLNADNTRIYPTLVIKDTILEQLYIEKKYEPLSIQAALEQTKELVILFESAHIFIQKIGLHPSEDLCNNNKLVAGPFHVNFREMVYTEIWNDLFLKEIKNDHHKHIQIECSPSEINYAIGYKKKNKLRLQQDFRSVHFHSNDQLKNREFHVFYSE